MALNIDPASIAEALRRNVESWEPSVDREEVGRGLLALAQDLAVAVRQPDDDQEQDEHVDHEVQPIAVDPEDREHDRGSLSGIGRNPQPVRQSSFALQEHPPQRVPDRDEHEDHQRDDERDGADQRERRGILALHSVDAQPAPAGRVRSATR